MQDNSPATEVCRVIYVDDEPGLLEIGKIFLENDHSFVVKTFLSAREALDHLASERYDAIVSDYQMPKMDGITFLKALRERGDATPFIIFTGRGREEVVIDALNSGADFYLQKGGDPQPQFAELAHKIHHAISRKRADLALKKSEQDYRKLIEHAGEGIFVTQDEVFKLVNPQLITLTGYAEQELLDQPFTRFIHPEDAGLLLDRYRKRMSGANFATHYIFRIICKDETVRWAELNVVSITWNERPAILNFLTDITERKRMEDSLRESEERYRQFFRTTLDGLFITTPDAQWIDFNDAILEMFGCTSRDEVFSRPIISFYVHPEERAVFVELVERDGYVKEHPVSFRKRDGTRFDSVMTVVPRRNPDGSTKAFIGTIRDITERKRMEDTLRESEERYHLFFKTAKDSVFITTPEGQWIDCNDAVVKTFGFASRDEVIGVPVISFYGRPEDRAVLVDLVEREGYVKEYPLSFRKRDGTCFDSVMTVVPQRNPDGSTKAFIGTIRDITDCELAEAALQESEERYRQIFNSFDDLYYETDVNGIITHLSPSLYHVTGYIQEELIGKPVTKIYANPESRNNLLNAIAKNGHVRDFEVLAVKRDGTETMASLNANLIYHADGTPAGVAGILRDITQRKHDEYALRESEEKFRSLVEYALEGILILDLHGQILFANTAAARTIEVGGGADLVGRSVMEFIAPESRPDAVRDFAQVVQGHDACFAQYHVISAKGSRKFVESIGKTVTYEGKTADLISIRDITARKRAEDALKESEEKYRLLIENSHDIIYTVNAEGKYIFISPSVTTLLGRRVSEVVGKNIRQFIHPDDLPHCLLAMKRTLEEGITQQEIEYRVSHADGSWRWHVSKTVPLRTGSGEITSIEGISSDITERRRADDALKQANRKLSLLSGITRHDIRNQLTVIRSYITLMERRHADPVFTEYLRNIDASAQRISTMIQFTKDYDEIGVRAPAWQDIQALVNATAMQVPLGRILVKNDISPGMGVFADPLIARVFYNLMDNAMRYGGKISAIRFAVQEREGDLIIVCEDDGNGIAAAEKEKIFERGFGKNTGLGLALSKEILAITGITMTENGVPGTGARFEMAVPAGSYRSGYDPGSPPACTGTPDHSRHHNQ
ncbi:response regulator [Methanoregula sp.]|uniref:response regulator n=1 Tax=Methanoregula sp. TaxID=2052170 RepID=UPI002369DCA5|nr:response regulator [Methanoregula sp.]MDD1687482.1 PAS domain S-box protein [Methanoregula sp.]